MEQILFYSNSARQDAGNKSELLAKIAGDLGIVYKQVLPIQTGQQIGYLAGLDGFEERKLSVLSMPPILPEEMLVICGLAGEKLDILLRALKNSGAGISLKAVLTPHNAEWSFSYLFEELRKERKALSGRSDRRNQEGQT